MQNPANAPRDSSGQRQHTLRRIQRASDPTATLCSTGWGTNTYGEVGDGTAVDRPTHVKVLNPAGAPDGFIWKQVFPSCSHVFALGSDGRLCAWGLNNYGAICDGTSPNSRNRPVRVNEQITPTGVDIGTVAGTNITAQTGGTWLVTTPAHAAGPVTVTIRWTRNGELQNDDSSNTYRFVSTLPLTGGFGIMLILLAGLITMTITTAHRHHRMATLAPNKISHE